MGAARGLCPHVGTHPCSWTPSMPPSSCSWGEPGTPSRTPWWASSSAKPHGPASAASCPGKSPLQRPLPLPSAARSVWGSPCPQPPHPGGVLSAPQSPRGCQQRGVAVPCYPPRPHMSCTGFSSVPLLLELLQPPGAAPVLCSGPGLGSCGSHRPVPGGRDTLPAEQVASWPWGGGTGVCVPTWGAGAPADGHEDVAPAGTAAVRPRCLHVGAHTTTGS